MFWGLGLGVFCYNVVFGFAVCFAWIFVFGCLLCEFGLVVLGGLWFVCVCWLLFIYVAFVFGIWFGGWLVDFVGWVGC